MRVGISRRKSAERMVAADRTRPHGFSCHEVHPGGLVRLNCPIGEGTGTGAVTMTAQEFRELALSLPEATEAAHMGHPDFRVRRRATGSPPHPTTFRKRRKRRNWLVRPMEADEARLNPI
jgi:hypothetical protein